MCLPQFLSLLLCLKSQTCHFEVISVFTPRSMATSSALQLQYPAGAHKGQKVECRTTLLTHDWCHFDYIAEGARPQTFFKYVAEEETTVNTEALNKCK